jgi:hypothetical protein
VPHDAELMIDTQDCAPLDCAQAIVARLRNDRLLD